MTKSFRLALASISATLLLCSTMTVEAAGRRREHALTTQELARRCLPSIVSLTILDSTGAQAAQGSGFVIAPNLIATNVHVVSGAHAVTANFANGRSETVYGVVTADFDRDMCLLYVNTTGIPALPLGSLDDVQVGDPVIALGCPEGLGPSISTGIVSGIRTRNGAKIVQTTAPISHGSSGGALVDRQGRVLGITSFFVDDGQNLNFAYASWYLSRLLPRGIVTYITWNEIELQYDKDHPTSSNSASTSPSTVSSVKPNDANTPDITEKPLAGLRGVRVTFQDDDNIGSKTGVDEDKLRKDAADRIRKAGIKVFDDLSDPGNPNGAELILGLQATKDSAGNYALLALTSVIEDVDFERGAPSSGVAGSWLRTIVVSTSPTDLPGEARSDIMQCVDQFIQEYKDQNPAAGK